MATIYGSELLDSSEAKPESDQARAPAFGPLHYTQVIHSGHFMVSSPHSDSDSQPSGSRGGRRPRYDFDTVNRTWCQTYRYGPLSSGSLSIDPTLTRIFECMSLAYSGTIVSPKWKSFKGLRLLWRDKIRLNNAIWRAWFIQYVEKRKNPVCGFVTPLEGSEADAHRKPEAIVLEGSYWKRRIEVVIKEYHKWRIYYKERIQKEKDHIMAMLQEGQICQAKLEKVSHQMYQEPAAIPEEAHMFDPEYLLSDISDTLFTMTQKQCPWPSQRHNTYTTNADMIQPGLTPLQPNLDDFMDIPDIFLNSSIQPCEQPDFTDSTYLESPSSIALAPFPPAHAIPQLLIDPQLSEVGVSSENLPHPSSYNPQPDRGGEYHSTTSQYGSQSCSDPALNALFPPNIEQFFSTAMPFFYPIPCHNFSSAPSSVTPSVITHTAYTMAGTSEPSARPQAGVPYTQPPQCHSLSYLPFGATQPPGKAPHRFAVPEVSSAQGRGKHKQKRGGLRTSGPPVEPSHAIPKAPISCLAKLLSTGLPERKPAVGFKSSRVTVKGQRSTSPRATHTSSQVQQSDGWRGAQPLLHNQRSSQGHSRSAKGSAASSLISDDAAYTSAAPLTPKTEKLSPVHFYGTDRNTLTDMGQTSPLEKSSNPESPYSGSLGYGMIESSKLTESRQISHISAEQKRHFNIKMGFDTLHSLVATLSSQPSIKISKATTLQKTAEYIAKMQQERALLHEEAQRLQNDIQILNSAINSCQQQLPATGVPITRQRFDHMRQKFREYVQAQTLQNWKFWIFSVIIEPLFESYNEMVSTASVEQLCQSTLSWLDQHCSLPSLRPMVLSSLRLLSTTTPILSDPRLLPEQAYLAVTRGDPSPSDHSIQNPAQDNEFLDPFSSFHS
ncbi:carbohydrate-responsive element-binding protein [Stigmatopora nigra]